MTSSFDSMLDDLLGAYECATAIEPPPHPKLNDVIPLNIVRLTPQQRRHHVSTIKQLRQQISTLQTQIEGTQSASALSTLKQQHHGLSRKLRDLKHMVRTSAALCIQLAWRRSKANRLLQSPRRHFPFSANQYSCNHRYQAVLSGPIQDAVMAHYLLPIPPQHTPTTPSTPISASASTHTLTSTSRSTPPSSHIDMEVLSLAPLHVREALYINRPHNHCGICLTSICGCGFYSHRIKHMLSSASSSSLLAAHHSLLSPTSVNSGAGLRLSTNGGTYINDKNLLFIDNMKIYHHHRQSVVSGHESMDVASESGDIVNSRGIVNSHGIVNSPDNVTAHDVFTPVIYKDFATGYELRILPFVECVAPSLNGYIPGYISKFISLLLPSSSLSSEYMSRITYRYHREHNIQLPLERCTVKQLVAEKSLLKRLIGRRQSALAKSLKRQQQLSQQQAKLKDNPETKGWARHSNGAAFGLGKPVRVDKEVPQLGYLAFEDKQKYRPLYLQYSKAKLMLDDRETDETDNNTTPAATTTLNVSQTERSSQLVYWLNNVNTTKLLQRAIVIYPSVFTRISGVKDYAVSIDLRHFDQNLNNNHTHSHTVTSDSNSWKAKPEPKCISLFAHCDESQLQRMSTLKIMLSSLFLECQPKPSGLVRMNTFVHEILNNVQKRQNSHHDNADMINIFTNNNNNLSNPQHRYHQLLLLLTYLQQLYNRYSCNIPLSNTYNHSQQYQQQLTQSHMKSSTDTVFETQYLLSQLPKYPNVLSPNDPPVCPTPIATTAYKFIVDCALISTRKNIQISQLPEGWISKTKNLVITPKSIRVGFGKKGAGLIPVLYALSKSEPISKSNSNGKNSNISGNKKLTCSSEDYKNDKKTESLNTNNILNNNKSSSNNDSSHTANGLSPSLLTNTTSSLSLDPSTSVVVNHYTISSSTSHTNEQPRNNTSASTSTSTSTSASSVNPSSKPVPSIVTSVNDVEAGFSIATPLKTTKSISRQDNGNGNGNVNGSNGSSLFDSSNPLTVIPDVMPLKNTPEWNTLYQQLKTEKRHLQLELNVFEREFEQSHGRKIRYQSDVQPVSSRWQRYRTIKLKINELSNMI